MAMKYPLPDPSPYDTDKGAHPHYLDNYARYVGRLRDRPVTLLELGVRRGGSLLMWRDYLPYGTIVGIDIDSVRVDDPTGRVQIYQGEQQDTALLDRIAAETAPDGFDCIIDDASHLGQPTRISFWHLFVHHLKPGGVYFIEDWGCGYFESFMDGMSYRPQPVGYSWYERTLNQLHASRVGQSGGLRRVISALRRRAIRKSFGSHHRGTVGVIKQLIDECGIEDITHPEWGIGNPRQSSIDHMRITLGHAVIVKSRLGE